MQPKHIKATLLAAASVFAVSALAQQDSTTAGIEAYREALQDGNPADLYVDSGAEIWKKKAGPKDASLEKCDLGLGDRDLDTRGTSGNVSSTQELHLLLGPRLEEHDDKYHEGQTAEFTEG